jgi:hypothetical protein
MRSYSYLRTTFILALGGTLFAGYLSGIKFFSQTCAFRESCPYFAGYPACYFGLAMFLTMFVVTALALSGKMAERAATKANAAVSFLGILFAGKFTWGEISLWLGGAAPRYTLGLPTCAYGLIFYVAIFVLSLLALRKRGAASTPAAAR